MLSDLFFSGESTFYLDNPVGARWVKSKQNYIHEKKLGRKLWHGLQLAQKEKDLCICMSKYEYPKLFKSIGRGYSRDEGTRNISRDVLFLQIENTNIIGQLKHLSFITKIILKLLIAYIILKLKSNNVWVIMKKKIAIKSLKIN